MISVALGVTLAIIVGGMITFQVLFAPLVFTQLKAKIARPFIRQFFPYYYLYFGLLALLSCVFGLLIGWNKQALMLVLCLAGFIVSRQILMPAANRASDKGETRRFSWLHRGTVLINTAQLTVYFFLMWRLS